jgi:hypothetical protein
LCPEIELGAKSSEKQIIQSWPGIRRAFFLPELENTMSKRRTIEDTMADAYDSSVARQQRVENEKNERAERLVGKTIEETMANVYDDIQDRDRGSRGAEQSYEYGAPTPTPEPEPERNIWYDEPDEPDDPYDEPENAYVPPKPTPVVQTYPSEQPPVRKPAPEPETEEDIYGPYADSNAFFSELVAQAPNPTPNPYAGRQAAPPAAPTPVQQPRNPYDPYGDYRPPIPRTPQQPRPPVVGEPMDWNDGNPWGNPYPVTPKVPPQPPHPAQNPPPPVVGDPFDWSGSNLFDTPYQSGPVAPRHPHPAQQPPALIPATVTPDPRGLQLSAGTDSSEFDWTEDSKLTKDFLDLITYLESIGDGLYQAKNGHALGRYQLTRPARLDTGMIEYIDYQKGEEWLEAYGAIPWERWLGKHGINSEEEFLNNPAVQEKVMEEYLTRYFAGIPGLQEQFDGLIIHGLGKAPDDENPERVREMIYLEDGALLAAAHREGPTGLKQYLELLKEHDGDSLKALTFEAVQEKFPDLDRVKVQAKLDKFERVETRLRQFQGIEPWKP